MELKDKKLVNLKEVCALLGVSPETVEALIKAKKLAPPLKVSEKRRAWKMSDLDEMIEQLERVEK